jgi:microcompartment protein CcmL/EutN
VASHILSDSVEYYSYSRSSNPTSTPETTRKLRRVSCSMQGSYAYRCVDVEAYGRCAVTLSGSHILSDSVEYYSYSRSSNPTSTPETTRKLRRVSCNMQGSYAYRCIDLEAYGRCAMTLSGSHILSHSVEYYSYSRSSHPTSTPETTQATPCLM